MVTREPRTLSRDVEVAAIPYGDKITLTAGTTVYITQSLGGSYTVMTDHGYLVRIEGTDADVIGEEPTQPLSAEEVDGRSTEEMAWAQMKTVFDPEIPVNIVDLGLVYRLDVDDGGEVEIDMTLTSPGCPVQDLIQADTELAAMRVEGVNKVTVTFVWDPVWTTQKMTEDGKKQMRMFGFNV